jgi:hypothetical protein
MGSDLWLGRNAAGHKAAKGPPLLTNFHDCGGIAVDDSYVKILNYKDYIFIVSILRISLSDHKWVIIHAHVAWQFSLCCVAK